MPNIRNKFAFGHLFVKFNIKFPKLDSKKKAKLWQLLTDTSYNKEKTKKLSNGQVLVDMISLDKFSENSRNNDPFSQFSGEGEQNGCQTQ